MTPPFCTVLAPGRSRFRLAGSWARTDLAKVRRSCGVSQGVVMTSMSPMRRFRSSRAAARERNGNLSVCFWRLNRSSSRTNAGMPSSSRAMPLSWVSQTIPRILNGCPSCPLLARASRPRSQRSLGGAPARRRRLLSRQSGPEPISEGSGMTEELWRARDLESAWAARRRTGVVMRARPNGTTRRRPRAAR